MRGGKPYQEHGLSKHPLYFMWKNMVSRCYYTGCGKYKNYGAKGVTVCDEWRHDFQSFYTWAMSNGWKKGLEIDKDKLSPLQTGQIYSPEYCCFLSHKENMKHTSNSKLVEYKGIVKPLIEWCENLELNYHLIFKRIQYCGWSIEKAFETPRKIRA